MRAEKMLGSWPESKSPKARNPESPCITESTVKRATSRSAASKCFSAFSTSFSATPSSRSDSSSSRRKRASSICATTSWPRVERKFSTAPASRFSEAFSSLLAASKRASEDLTSFLACLSFLLTCFCLLRISLLESANVGAVTPAISPTLIESANKGVATVRRNELM